MTENLESKEKYLDISVLDGKYQIIQETPNDPIKVLRYGEIHLEDLQLWNIHGGNALTAALHELSEFQKNEKLKL